jgi:hypothetical protein
MKSGSVIFVVLVVLLVPVIYSSSTLHDACAAPRDPHFDKDSKCTGDKYTKGGQTCCWRVQVPGKLLGDTYCQTCNVESDSKGTYERCTPPTKQAMTGQGGPLGRLQESGVLEEPLQNFSQSAGPRLGGVLQGESNLTFSEANISSSNSSTNTIPSEQSELVISDTLENSTKAVNAGEQVQDESVTTEEGAGEAEDNDKEDENESEDEDEDTDKNDEESQPQEQ